jgi:adenylate cyclase class 2
MISASNRGCGRAAVLEIELKASIDDQTFENLDEKLKGRFIYLQSLEEEDHYYNAPDRDFKKTDEALRIREIRGTEKQSCLTYKGPKLDALSNTRAEYETPVDQAQALHEILNALGYRVILAVRKKRLEYGGTGDLEDVTLCLDQVENLGAFIELEYVAPDHLSDKEREGVRDRLLSLLDDLGIPRRRLVRESYLELLIRRATSKKSSQGS